MIPVVPYPQHSKQAVEAQRAILEPRICARILEAIKARPTPCALLMGPTGSGKTTAAYWMQCGLKALRASVAYDDTGVPFWMTKGQVEHMRARDLASSSRRHGLGDGFAPEVVRGRDASVLCVDDVGSEGADVTALQDVLDWRYEHGCPTIITSGLTREQLTNHLGPAYLRRVLDQHVLRKDGSEFPVLVSEP